MKQFGLVILIALLVAGYVFRHDLVSHAPEWVQARLMPAAAPAAAHAPVAPPVAVTVVAATSGTLPVLRQTVGTIVPVNSTTLSPQKSGTIADILVKDGAEVAAGDLLIRLDDSVIQAQLTKDQAQVSKDQATLTDAQKTYQRTQRLTASGVDTVQANDNALAALRVAEGALAVDQASFAADQVQLAQTQIRAPFAGRLGAVQLSVGAYVGAGTPLVVITQIKPTLLQFTLPETDFALLRQTMAAGTLTVAATPVLAGEQTGATATGPVTFLNNAVDPASGAIMLRAQLANADETFWPGQMVDVRVQAGTTPQLVLVPGIAVAPGSTVFVARPDNTVAARQVTVAMRASDLAGVSAGLQPGEKVVTSGQGTLEDGSRVTVVAPISDAPATAAPSPHSRAVKTGGAPP